MNEKPDLGWIVAIITVMVASGAVGAALGHKVGTRETTTLLTHEAVREKAGAWTSDETGAPIFKWLACIPAKPQELKK